MQKDSFLQWSAFHSAKIIDSYSSKRLVSYRARLSVSQNGKIIVSYSLKRIVSHSARIQCVLESKRIFPSSTK